MVIENIAGSPATLGRARQAAIRTGAVAAVLGVAALCTIASQRSSTSSAVSYLAKYSPERLADGRIWTLPASAFLVGHPHMIGPTTFFVVLIFLPYALWKGIGRAGIAAMSGHVLSTLAVAAVVLPASSMGWSTGRSIAFSTDYGASAALAACAGGLIVALWRRAPVVAAVVLVAVAGWFVNGLVTVHTPMANVADVEHLVALGTGMVVEWWFGTRRGRTRVAGSTPAEAGA